MAEEIHLHDNRDNEPFRTFCKKYVSRNGITENRDLVTCPECLVEAVLATKHQCEGYTVDYMRGTPCGRGSRCEANAKVVRDGKYYCLIHDPVKVAERQKKRDKKWEDRMKSQYKIFGFRVNGQRIYDIEARSESEAKTILVDRIIEIKIECLGELKK